ncbi:preprotein translocase subunit SecG [Methylocella sp.]|uniref:preprotein translocase subunit SecG n=1 Tax=Methylocella sp. TaxID=1978226 RepID=UPI0037836A33
MQTVLIVIHLMIVIALVVTVLLQRSEGGALGVGGGGGFMTGRGQANVLTRATAVLAALFFFTSLTLTIVAKFGQARSPIVNAPPAATQSAPAAPQAPAPAQGGSLLDQLRQMENQRQSTPPAGQ